MIAAAWRRIELTGALCTVFGHYTPRVHGRLLPRGVCRRCERIVGAPPRG